jgi:hypothetical protein
VHLTSQVDITQEERKKIPFDGKIYDSDNNFDTATHAWTCPKNGVYAVNLQAAFKGGGDDESREAIIGSGTKIFTNNVGASKRHGSSDFDDDLSLTTINKYSSGDTIAAYATNQDSNDKLDGTVENFATFLEVAFLGGL